jgi:hypothetical protein
MPGRTDEIYAPMRRGTAIRSGPAAWSVDPDVSLTHIRFGTQVFKIV